MKYLGGSGYVIHCPSRPVRNYDRTRSHSTRVSPVGRYMKDNKPPHEHPEGPSGRDESGTGTREGDGRTRRTSRGGHGSRRTEPVSTSTYFESSWHHSSTNTHSSHPWPGARPYRTSTCSSGSCPRTAGKREPRVRTTVGSERGRPFCLKRLKMCLLTREPEVGLRSRMSERPYHPGLPVRRYGPSLRPPSTKSESVRRHGGPV